MEIIAAVGPDPNALGNNFRYNPQQTFIARPDAEISWAVGRLQGRPGSISMRDIIASIRSNPERVPEYKIQLGSLPIYFTVARTSHSSGSSQSSPRRQTSSGTQEASLTLSSPSAQPARVRHAVIFSAVIDECDLENGDHQETVAWLRSAGPSVVWI